MKFWNLKQGDEGCAEMRIEGEIVMQDDWWGDGGNVVARDFCDALDRVTDVTVYINSPGGDVFAGAAMYSALREHRKRCGGRVTVKISGIAASAASVVAMAGDEILMSPVAYMMIHEPWTIAMGNAREMEHEAKVLREIGEGIIAAYTERTGKTHDEIAAMLADETYMSAQTCIDEGFADGFFGTEGEDSGRTEMRRKNYSAQKYCAMMRAHAPEPKEEPEEPDYGSTEYEDKHRAAIKEYAMIMAEMYK